MKIFKHLPMLIGAMLIVSINTLAQTPIDITTEHASLGNKFANRIWSSFEGSVISVPQRQIMPSGKKGDYIKLTFRNRIRKESFRSALNRVVNGNSDMVNAAGGWTDQNGEVMALIVLNVFDRRQRAICLVLYNENTGIAVFNTMSSNL